MRSLGALALLTILAAPAAAAPPPGATSCTGCHGAPTPSSPPPIAGRPAADLEAAMLAFRGGTRPATLMDRLMKGFSPAEIQALATWWAAQ